MKFVKSFRRRNIFRNLFVAENEIYNSFLLIVNKMIFRIFELLIIDDQIRQMITRKASSDEIRKYAVEHGMKTLYQDGMEKVKAGATTLDEVLRVTELE